MNKWFLTQNSLQAQHCSQPPATDVGMHGLLASQSCYHSVLPPCLSTLSASSLISSLLNRHPYILLISLEIFFITLLKTNGI